MSTSKAHNDGYLEPISVVNVLSPRISAQIQQILNELQSEEVDTEVTTQAEMTTSAETTISPEAPQSENSGAAYDYVQMSARRSMHLSPEQPLSSTTSDDVPMRAPLYPLPGDSLESVGSMVAEAPESVRVSPELPPRDPPVSYENTQQPYRIYQLNEIQRDGSIGITTGNDY